MLYEPMLPIIPENFSKMETKTWKHSDFIRLFPKSSHSFPSLLSDNRTKRYMVLAEFVQVNLYQLHPPLHGLISLF